DAAPAAVGAQHPAFAAQRIFLGTVHQSRSAGLRAMDLEPGAVAGGGRNRSDTHGGGMDDGARRAAAAADFAILGVDRGAGFVQFRILVCGFFWEQSDLAGARVSVGAGWAN